MKKSLNGPMRGGVGGHEHRPVAAVRAIVGRRRAASARPPSREAVPAAARRVPREPILVDIDQDVHPVCPGCFGRRANLRQIGLVVATGLGFVGLPEEEEANDVHP